MGGVGGLGGEVGFDHWAKCSSYRRGDQRSAKQMLHNAQVTEWLKVWSRLAKVWWRRRGHSQAVVIVVVWRCVGVAVGNARRGRGGK